MHADNGHIINAVCFVTDFVFWFRFSKGINPSTRCLFRQRTSREKNWVCFLSMYVCEREIVILYGNYKTFMWIPAVAMRGHPTRNWDFLLLFIFSNRTNFFCLKRCNQEGLRRWSHHGRPGIIIRKKPCRLLCFLQGRCSKNNSGISKDKHLL